MLRIGKQKKTTRPKGSRKKARLKVVLRRFAVVSVVLISLGWVGSWLWFGGIIHKGVDHSKHAYYNLTAKAGFTVKNFLVEGREYTDPELLLAITNIEKGAPLFLFDPQEAQEMIERISWVRKANVTRRLPDTIHIKLIEKRPLALWQHNKKIRLIDDQGTVIAENSLQRFKELILIVGENAPENAPSLFGTLAFEDTIAERVESASWVGERRWDLFLRNKVQIKLPEEDPALALRRLAVSQEKDQIMDRDIKAIDLRDPDVITVQTNPGEIQKYKASFGNPNEI